MFQVKSDVKNKNFYDGVHPKKRPDPRKIIPASPQINYSTLEICKTKIRLAFSSSTGKLNGVAQSQHKQLREMYSQYLASA